MSNATDLRMPKPKRVVLDQFSLYARTKRVEADFDKSVFCLAGANGLGKSTFLAAINFAICGVVAEPEKNFIRYGDYYDDLLSYSSNYFSGRITADDHLAAQVELEMTIGERSYRIVRGMFATQGLRVLEITEADGEITTYDDSAFDDSERHREYEAAVLADTGLDDFSQLVFLQLLVLTFDEERRLLFWDERVAETALYLAFGISAEQTSQLENYQKTIDSADSLVRNLQWQATGVRRELEALERAISGKEVGDQDLQGEHERLEQRLEDCADHYEKLETDWRDAQVRMADSGAEMRVEQARYDRLFADRLRTRRHTHSHPMVVDAVDGGSCGICGANGEEVSSEVAARLKTGICPLCGSDLPEDSGEDDAALIAEIRESAEKIVALENDLETRQQEVSRLRTEADAAESDLRESRAELDGFKKANSLALARRAVEDSGVDSATEGLRNQIAHLMERKGRERERREAAKAALSELHTELMKAYTAVEHEFVPRFQELAHLFLGIDLEIDLEIRSAKLRLRLALAQSDRRSPDELSESQRFFLDIALRMALAERLGAGSGGAFLYVDTPEGSLDIAYENQAGEMFASFVEGGGELLMTANINTSELLLRLAERCGAEQMKLVRMTNWTYLSEVQQAHEALFEKAFTAIEQKLEAAR